MTGSIVDLTARPGDETLALDRFHRARRSAASYAFKARRMRRRDTEIWLIHYLYAPLPGGPAKEGIE